MFFKRVCNFADDVVNYTFFDDFVKIASYLLRGKTLVQYYLEASEPKSVKSDSI